MGHDDVLYEALGQLSCLLPSFLRLPGKDNTPMNSIHRRTFLKAVAAFPFAVWLGRNGFAATSPVVRYDVLSTEGQAMLHIYADGVAKMKALFESDPLSWTFQWYTHAVRADRTKTT